MWRKRNAVAEELSLLNAHLALIAEVLQKDPALRYWQQPRIEAYPAPPTKIQLPQSVTDATELLARWLWLQLPEESKKDLMS